MKKIKIKILASSYEMLDDSCIVLKQNEYKMGHKKSFVMIINDQFNIF